MAKRKIGLGGTLETVETRSWVGHALVVCVLVTLGAAAIVFVGEELSVPLWAGWGVVLIYYLLVFVALIIAVRYNRQISLVFRVVHHVSIVIVPLYIVSAFIIGGRALFEGLNTRGLQGQLLWINWFRELLYVDARGVGLLYLGVFMFIGRLALKFERDAVAAAPLAIGDTRLRSATIAEMEDAGLFSPEGSFLGLKEGQIATVPWGDRLIVAPQGSGKTIGTVLPALSRERRPVAGTDVKGEIVAVASDARLYLGEDVPWRTVYVIDPYRLTEAPGFFPPGGALGSRFQRVSFNPFWRVDVRDRETVDRKLDAAIDSVCVPLKDDEGENSQHFFDLARILIRGVAWAGLVSADAGDTLDGTLIEMSPAWIRDVLVKTGGELEKLVGWLMGTGRYGEEAAVALAVAGDKERGSIFTSALRRLSWMEDLNIRRVLGYTDINFPLINSGLADVFVVCPADQVESKREWVQATFKGILEYIETQPAEDRPDRDWLILVEEAGQFGYLAPFEDSFSRIRGYGARIWMVFQRRGQMEAYEDPDTFESAAVIQVFGTQDGDTLEWVCQVAGKRRVLRSEVSEGGQATVAVGGRGGPSMQAGRTIKEEEADVLTADVVRGLGSRTGIAFINGVAQPVLYDVVRYFERADLFPRMRPNPLEQYRKSDRATVWRPTS